MERDFTAHDVAERARLITHERYAEVIDRDPSILDRARAMLDAGIAENGGTMGQRLWAVILKQPDWKRVRPRLLQNDQDGRLLRSNSPFSELIGVSNPEERTSIWRRAKAELSDLRISNGRSAA